MNLSDNTILITGGATGIGFALVEELHSRGNRIIICGRREDRLRQVQEKYPDVIIRVCDVTDKAQREDLFAWAASSYPELNILVNNAGIQHYIDFNKGTKELDLYESEVDVNLTAPIHLCGLFVPLLSKKANAVIINISSTLGVLPIVSAPVYCASKAGFHIFTRCLRKQLQDTSVKVFEVLPPAVESELNARGRAKQQGRSYVPADVYAALVIAGLEKDTYEINSEYLEKMQNASLRDANIFLG